MTQRPASHTDTPCASSAANRVHPYYIVATGFQHADIGNRLMHRLCSWLNQAGHESWMITTDTDPNLWAPKLHDAIRAQHHTASKCPIVVFFDEKLAASAQLGTNVHYCLFSQPLANLSQANSQPVRFTWHSAPDTLASAPHTLNLPFLNLAHLIQADAAASAREDVLLFAEAYLAAGGKASELPIHTARLTSEDLQNESALSGKLARARLLYLFEPSALSAIARAHGCAVVHVRGTHAWPATSGALPYGDIGLVETTDLHAPPDCKPWTVQEFLGHYTQLVADWPHQLARFVSETQRIAEATPLQQAWPEEVVLGLPVSNPTMQAAALRADRIKQLRVNQQLAKWAERSSLREIDGEIYGNYAASGQLPQLAAVVYADTDTEALATTLESLGNNLLQPSELTIISGQPNPFGDGAIDGMTWQQLPADWHTLDEFPPLVNSPLRHLRAPWVLAIRAGATLQPHALLEFSISARQTTASVLYADDDLLVNGKPQYPNFKPHTNTEWLRSTNYLGDAVLLRSAGWKAHRECHRFEGVYAHALQTLEAQGRKGLLHIDTLLVHGSGQLTDAQLSCETRQLQSHLVRSNLSATVSPGNQRGLRNVSYTPAESHQVSVVVPCATQTGYLACLLQSMVTHHSPLLREVIVVTDNEFADRVQHAVNDVKAGFAIRVVSLANSPYSHAKALNAGAAQATGDVLLFADDDTELTHNNWLEPLCGHFGQADVAAVAPRLFGSGSPDPVVCGGPVFLGLNGLTGTYCGELGNTLESGPYGRLQAAQDVSAFMPHFFLVSAKHFRQVGGFDETHFPLFLPVLDFALRAGNKGLRHVWTPQTNVFHQGGTTLAEKKRLPESVLALQQAELVERSALLSRWTSQLGTDPNYNRNLSLAKAFDLEQDIVIDWQTSRHDRPRTVAVPLSSGSGQYRVVEPLNALQNEGRAQSCVVFPISRMVSRVPTSIELVRSGLDRLIVQNAINDLQMARLEEYRLNLPQLGIIHMLDDLFGNLPSKHHLHSYHKREGNTRLRRSLELSDRLVVTTEPLKEYYEAYVPETRVIPNALVESTWFDLPVTRRARQGKLRVGWAGAQQHLGDLDMIQTVVAHFAQHVDWVFMGMCPPSIQPHVKEVHPFVSIDVYPQTLANLDLDIAIAPLEDNHFNTCKSNLRLLEYGAMGWPVVCSDVYPFRTDNPPVSRVPNELDAWIAALDTLINDESLRRRMGTQLNHWVKTRYALGVHTDAWFKAIFDPIQR